MRVAGDGIQSVFGTTFEFLYEVIFWVRSDTERWFCKLLYRFLKQPLVLRIAYCNGP
jgi:hypothetical protein